MSDANGTDTERDIGEPAEPNLDTQALRDALRPSSVDYYEETRGPEAVGDLPFSKTRSHCVGEV